MAIGIWVMWIQGNQVEDKTEQIGRNGRDGSDGFSPLAAVKEIPEGAEIIITDKSGTTRANIYNGVTPDISGKLDVSKVKNAYSSTGGDVYDVTYINTMIGDIESVLSEV